MKQQIHFPPLEATGIYLSTIHRSHVCGIPIIIQRMSRWMDEVWVWPEAICTCMHVYIYRAQLPSRELVRDLWRAISNRPAPAISPPFRYSVTIRCQPKYEGFTSGQGLGIVPLPVYRIGLSVWAISARPSCSFRVTGRIHYRPLPPRVIRSYFASNKAKPSPQQSLGLRLHPCTSSFFVLSPASRYTHPNLPESETRIYVRYRNSDICFTQRFD